MVRQAYAQLLILNKVPCQLIVDSNKITEPKEIASALNKYSVNVPQQINKDIPRTKKSPMDYFNDRAGHSFFLSPTDSKGIESIILSFNNSKSVGPYSILIRLLKILASEISESLSLIVNNSFCKCSYPGNLKLAK